MGNAKRRGTFEQRKAQAIERQRTSIIEKKENKMSKRSAQLLILSEVMQQSLKQKGVRTK